MHPYTVNSERLKIYILIGLVSALLTPLANRAIIHHIFSGLEPWVGAGPSFGLIYGILFGIYNRYIWRWRWLSLFGLPTITNLSGKYEGTLISSYKTKTEIALTLEVVQTWTRLLVYIRTGTDSSESYSYMASLFEVDDKSSRLTYTYTNEPFSAIADADMQPHDGTARLGFRRDGSVMGTYFNARMRIGTITLTKQPKPAH
jgi:hypothetical protein